MWELSAWSTLAYTVLVILILFLVSKLLSPPPPAVNIRDNRTGHKWLLNQFIIDFPLHCNACETFLFTAKGQCCVNCGAAACSNTKCIRTVDRKNGCKSVSRSKSAEEAAIKVLENPKHRWAPGNLPFDSVCTVCDEPAGDGPGIKDFRCIWCQRTVHSECLENVQESCNYGKHKNFIVPPESVVVKPSRTLRRRIISKVVLPPLQTIRPLVVIGNNKSGSSDCANLLAAFRRHLNPAQVIDLAETDMEEGLEWCHLAAPATCCFLVCGGDGTVGWLFNAAEKLQLSHPPMVAILPLGTGNDLARTLGYGSGTDSSENVSAFMDRLEKARVVRLDRWKVEVVPRRHLRIRLPRTSIFMNNYLSIGVDALVTFNFHKARESPFYLISSRIINKLIYFSYGTKDVLERQCQNLNNNLRLYMDGKKIELPSIESVVVLNIPFWGAGVRPWTLGSGHRDFACSQDIADRKLEVFCVYSSFHIAQMQVGLSEPHRIGQATEVRIELLDSAPMQIDGEPWEQHPADILITHHTQVPVLAMD